MRRNMRIRAIIAVIIISVIVIVFVVLNFLLQGEPPYTPGIEMTASAVTEANATTLAHIRETQSVQTQSAP
jgi:hypothetical protein